MSIPPPLIAFNRVDGLTRPYSMAYAVIRLVICKLLWNFDLQLSPESDNWMSGQAVFMLYIKPPLVVKFTPVPSAGS